MIFLTVGTQFSFDRLVKAVDVAVANGCISEQVYAQIGNSSYQPRNFRSISSLDKPLFDQYIRQSSCVIGHAGMGTVSMVLSNNKPMLAMPRRKKYREVVNDHQVVIARKLEESGHILVAYDQEALPEKLRELKHFVPQGRNSDSEAIINKISEFLSNLNQSLLKSQA